MRWLVVGVFVCGLIGLHTNTAIAQQPEAVLVAEDSVLGNGSINGPATIGGDLALAGPFQVSELVVGGRVDFASSDRGAVLKVAGRATIADLTGAFAVRDRLVPVDDYEATPRIEANAIAQGEPGDVTERFAALRQWSADLRDCTGLNVLNLTGAELNALPILVPPVPPSETTPLLINVDTSGTDGIFTWHSLDFAAVASEQARYVLINFPDATDVHHADGGVIRGTILAPNARFVDRNPSPIEGALVVKALEGGAGELRPYPLAAKFADAAAERGLITWREDASGAMARRPMVWFGLAATLAGLAMLAALWAARGSGRTASAMMSPPPAVD